MVTNMDEIKTAILLMSDMFGFVEPDNVMLTKEQVLNGLNQLSASCAVINMIYHHECSSMEGLYEYAVFLDNPHGNAAILLEQWSRNAQIDYTNKLHSFIPFYCMLYGYNLDYVNLKSNLLAIKGFHTIATLEQRFLFTRTNGESAACDYGRVLELIGGRSVQGC